ncbi:type II toxin-antitoxin system RelE/ParE family toxin [Microcoleus sp. S28C3]|uniref:type II toxin-antitoxin system RelE/ParE family toxin n=1 Tax=Microcoleus sp. S28C3 TaxID=3055414 RepID=UPI002FD75520
MRCYKLLKKIFVTGLLIVATVPHYYRKRYNLKKLKGEDNAYRFRVGDYRIGFYFDGETVTFARVLHRKDIYRYFPP